MKAVIIAGGLGTRMRPLTYHIPKPIVPVANRPFVVHQIEHLVKHGVTEVILNLHYMHGEIKKMIGDGREWGIKIHYSLEEKPLGTAGAVKKAEKYFDKGPLVIFNGDILTDINITKVVNYHREKNATVTLTLKEVEDPTSFGLVLTDQEGRVTKFIEKPSWAMVTAKTINAGIYVVDPKIFAEVPRDQEYSFECQLYPSLLEKGTPIFGYLSAAYWIDIGNPRKYQEVHQAILRGEVAVKIYGTRLDGKIWLGKNTNPDRSVKLSGPAIIGEGVRIGKNSEIRDYVVIGDGVTVGERCVLDRTIIWKGARIGRDVALSDCILGKDCVVEDEAVIDGGAVLADGSVVKKGTQISS